MKLKIIISCLFLLNKINLNAQSYFGFGLTVNNFKLINISKDTLVPYGYSGAKISQIIQYQLNPNIFYKKQFSKLISLQIGVGYLPYKYGMRIKYYSNSFALQVDTPLNVTLHHIAIPVDFSYKMLNANKYSVMFTGRATSRVLISQNDNFEEIILESIGWAKRNWYSQYCLSFSGGLLFRKMMANNSHLDLSVFYQRDVLPNIIKNTWGIYNNFYPSRNQYIGISINYFSQLKNKMK